MILQAGIPALVKFVLPLIQHFSAKDLTELHKVDEQCQCSITSPGQALPKAEALPGVQSGLHSAKGADPAAGSISVLSYAYSSAEVQQLIVLGFPKKHP